MSAFNLNRARPGLPPPFLQYQKRWLLFQMENGIPLRFYIRPGVAKMELAPLILRQGGRLSPVQEPGAILLACPGEVPAGAPGDYISTSYITDCIARKARLPLENYRLNPQQSPSAAAQTKTTFGGRMPFTEAEDWAIMLYVQNRKQRGLAGNLGGITFWQDMVEARVTPHSWQAMRDRYLRYLRSRENLYVPGPRPRPRKKDAGKKQLRTPNTASSQNKKPTDVSQTQGPGQATGASKTPSIFQMANKEFEDSEEDSENLSDEEEIIPENAEPQTAAEGGMPPDPKNQAVESTDSEDLVMSESLLPAEEQPSGPSAEDVALAVEDMKRFMEEFGVDLDTVTQAFLKNSGEVAAAACCLKTGQRSDGCPLWTRQDDLDLLTGSDDLRSKLLSKYGAENVNARMAFRKS